MWRIACSHFHSSVLSHSAPLAARLPAVTGRKATMSARISTAQLRNAMVRLQVGCVCGGLSEPQCFVSMCTYFLQRLPLSLSLTLALSLALSLCLSLCLCLSLSLSLPGPSPTLPAQSFLFSVDPLPGAPFGGWAPSHRSGTSIHRLRGFCFTGGGSFPESPRSTWGFWGCPSRNLSNGSTAWCMGFLRSTVH